MKNFFKSMIFLIILVLSFFYYEEKIFKRYDVLVDYAYYKIPKDNIDLLFIGSSHSYCSFNSRLFDHYLRCNSLNLGTNSQTFPITYSAILEILKKQTPKVIVIEVFPIRKIEPSIVALRPHLDTMNLSINKLRLIKNSLPISEWGNHFMNTIYYHSRWKEFKQLKVLNKKIQELDSICNSYEKQRHQIEALLNESKQEFGILQVILLLMTSMKKNIINFLVINQLFQKNLLNYWKIFLKFVKKRVSNLF